MEVSARVIIYLREFSGVLANELAQPTGQDNQRARLASTLLFELEAIRRQDPLPLRPAGRKFFETQNDLFETQDDRRKCCKSFPSNVFVVDVSRLFNRIFYRRHL